MSIAKLEVLTPALLLVSTLVISLWMDNAKLADSRPHDIVNSMSLVINGNYTVSLLILDVGAHGGDPFHSFAGDHTH